MGFMVRWGLGSVAEKPQWACGFQAPCAQAAFSFPGAAHGLRCVQGSFGASRGQLEPPDARALGVQ